MAITTARVTVSTSAVALNPAETDTVAGSVLILKNTSANAADLGPTGVTAGTGFDLAAAATLTVQLPPGEVLFAIRTAAADAIISVLRIGV